MPRFQDSISRHFERLRQAAGLPVVYVRNGVEIDLLAVAAQTKITVIDESGISVRAARRDWLIRAADLCVNGQPFTPAVGDYIRAATVTDGVCIAITYAVQAIAGEDCFADGGDGMLRVHTKIFETEQT